MINNSNQELLFEKEVEKFNNDQTTYILTEALKLYLFSENEQVKIQTLDFLRKLINDNRDF